ncbi:hypothetical protein BH09ACT8_BH09ACT8_17950 [soil metagenome]
MKIVVTGLAVATAVLMAPPAVADDGVFFVSPLAGISCEIDWQREGILDQVYCQNTSSPQTVILDGNGVLKTCRQPPRADGITECNLGDPGDAPTLAYGQIARSGPFICQSEATGVTCTIPSGLGFTISPSGVVPVG